MILRTPGTVANALRCLLLASVLLSSLASGPRSAAAATREDQTPLFGMHGHFVSDGIEQTKKDLDELKAANQRVAKFEVDWAALEPKNNRFDQVYLEQIDAVLDEMEKRAIRPIILFWTTPAWARPSGTKGCKDKNKVRWAPPDQNKVGEFGQAIGVLAKRHRARPGIAYEIWNEPNDPTWWCVPYSADDQRVGQRYTGMLKSAYDRINLVDPDATVLGGSIAFGDLGFLTDMYKYGARGKFDALALHPYSFDKAFGPDDLDRAHNGYHSFKLAVPRMEATMARNREPDKQIWITEMGFDASRMTDRTRGAHFKRSVQLVQGWPYVKAFLGYVLHEPLNPNYELYPLGGAPTLSWLAYTAATKAAPKPGVDRRSPVGAVTINRGAKKTASRVVTLRFTARDPRPASGVVSMRIKNAGQRWGEWTAYRSSAKWTLSRGDGTKTVYVQYADRAHNLSSSAKDTIVLDS